MTPLLSSFSIFVLSCGIPGILFTSVRSSGGSPTRWILGRLFLCTENVEEPDMVAFFTEVVLVGDGEESRTQQEAFSGGLVAASTGSSGAFRVNFVQCCRAL